ncbi:glycoside hydrolase family 99-like domain-containing protein [Xanthobacter sp. V0B-10]|uniref:glycosyltransferase WbsX family protein n=1 Tax=Xanthobacter albus TaxID=3119929 RepID=UPI00372BA7D1
MNDLTHAKDEIPAAQPPQEDRQAAETRIVTPDLSDLESPPHWRGAADIFAGTRIVGWVVSTRTPMRPVALDVFLLGEKVLTDITSELRPDIAAVLRLPVKAGYDIDLLKMSPVAAQAVMKRLKAESRSTLPVGEILELRIADTDVVVRLSDSLRHEEMPLARLAEILAPLAGRFEGDQSGMIRLRDRLLEAPLSGEAASVDVVAYYLPQFHPFPENDTWWGKGFSEWTNVTTAKPLFDGHYQPHLPADLGFYDLRLDQVQRDQVALAKRYGIRGFCYYYYWFSGQTLMTLPIDRHVDLDLDLDFCLCWANESWSRRWDGSEADVLMAQRHTFDSDIGFIRSCIRYFRSDRYIKIDGAPLIQVYRISLMERPRETLDRWREIAREEGFPDLHICMVESFDLKDPYEYGCDSSCEFPPHGVVGEKINDRIEALDPRYSGTIYDYAEIVRREIARPTPSHPRFRTAMPSWDNTARKGTAGNVFAGATPALFETWMRHLVADACKQLPEDRRFVFVNAWNEWAEGTHLEPDREHGHANLRAVRNALTPESLALAPLLAPTDGSEDRLAETRRYVEGLIRANRALTGLIRRETHDLRVGDEQGLVPVPASIMSVEWVSGAAFNIESLNGRPVDSGGPLLLRGDQAISVRGWFAWPGKSTRIALLALRSTSAPEMPRYVTPIHLRIQRPDVAAALKLDDAEVDCGFSVSASLRGLAPGRYEIELLTTDSSKAAKAIAAPTSIQLVIG